MAFIVALKKKGGGKGNEVEFDEMDLLRSDAKVPLPTKEDPAYIMEDVLKKKIIGRTVTWRSMRVVLTKYFLGFAKVERSADEEGDDVGPPAASPGSRTSATYSTAKQSRAT